ncbi:MAG: YlxR family protein [Actinomycetota bacterium]
MAEIPSVSSDELPSGETAVVFDTAVLPETALSSDAALPAIGTADDGQVPDGGPRRFATKNDHGGPRRWCVGCRQRDNQSSLVRFVADRDKRALVCDDRRRLPGRGVWLHPRSRCAQLAVRRSVLTRALRLSGSIDVTALAVISQDEVLPA